MKVVYPPEYFIPSLESGSAAPPRPRSRFSLSRLIREEPGVRGFTWFSRRREDRLHLFAGIIHLLFQIIFAPITAILPILPIVAPIINLFTPFDVSGLATKVKKTIPYNPDEEEVDDDLILPDAVLWNAPGTQVNPGGDFDPRSLIYEDHSDVYEATNFEPKWMLRVIIRNGQYINHTQVEWTANLRGHGYTALSYDMEAAFVLFQDAGKQMLDPKPQGKARWSPRDRRRISEQFLIEYCSAIGHLSQDREEFIWLDEHCISPDTPTVIDDGWLREIRNEELGRLTDIFSGAQTVVAFCHELDCDHSTMRCRWGNRLFTLSEILHTNQTRQMTRKVARDTLGTLVKQCHVSPIESGHSFRGRMMYEAARAKKWHLHSILRHSTNSGGDTWQMAIHALIVEAIRRDRESGYLNHEYLGKGLNGLLPRRARLIDLKSKDGWADLAWLLELNQGFYNMASLAAVCCLASKEQPEAGSGWLGPPIEPKAGNERLEPLVHAFTVGEKDELGRPTAPLNFVGAQTIGIHPYVRRDGDALFNNEDAKRFKVISITLLATFDAIGFAFVLAFFLLSLKSLAPVIIGFGMIYLASIAFNLFCLIANSQYIERSGWVFLSEEKWGDGRKGDAAWGKNPSARLQQLDPTLELEEWGDRQMVPKWDYPEQRHMRGCLVDLRTGTVVRTIVSEPPNSMMVLAIHGSGVTYMLLNRPEGTGGVARRVGMASLPPFTLGFTNHCGAMKVGMYEDQPEPKAKGSWYRGLMGHLFSGSDSDLVVDDN